MISKIVLSLVSLGPTERSGMDKCRTMEVSMGGGGGRVLDWGKVDVNNWGMENDSTTISFFHDKTVLRTGHSILSKSP